MYICIRSGSFLHDLSHIPVCITHIATCVALVCITHVTHVTRVYLPVDVEAAARRAMAKLRAHSCHVIIGCDSPLTNPPITPQTTSRITLSYPLETAVIILLLLSLLLSLSLSLSVYMCILLF